MLLYKRATTTYTNLDAIGQSMWVLDVNRDVSQIWHFMLIITLLHRWRLGDPKFKARLSFETLSQNTKGKGCSSVEKYLPTICEPWNSIPRTAKQNVKDGAPITLLPQYKDRLIHSELLSA